MTEEERAKLEAIGNGAAYAAENPSAAYHDGCMEQVLKEGVPWLIALARELDEQIEKNAEVIETVRELGEAVAHLNDGRYSRSRADEEVSAAKKRILDVAEKVYYAVREEEQ